MRDVDGAGEFGVNDLRNADTVSASGMGAIEYGEHVILLEINRRHGRPVCPVNQTPQGIKFLGTTNTVVNLRIDVDGILSIGQNGVRYRSGIMETSRLGTIKIQKRADNNDEGTEPSDKEQIFHAVSITRAKRVAPLSSQY